MSLENLSISDLIRAAREEEASAPRQSTSTDSITVRTPSGDARPLRVSGPISISEAMSQLGMTIAPSAEFWVNGDKVLPSYVIAPGTTVSIMGGNVKGG